MQLGEQAALGHLGLSLLMDGVSVILVTAAPRSESLPMGPGRPGGVRHEGEGGRSPAAEQGT